MRGLKYRERVRFSEPNWSHPTRVRGLKFLSPDTIINLATVAPYTGAWIEIRNGNVTTVDGFGRTLHGCVD